MNLPTKIQRENEFDSTTFKLNGSKLLTINLLRMHKAPKIVSYSITINNKYNKMITLSINVHNVKSKCCFCSFILYVYL